MWRQLRRPWAVWPALLALALFAVVACDDDDDDEDTVATAPAPAAAAPAAAAITNTVVQIGPSGPATAESTATFTGWQTEAAEIVGVRLIAQFDSSGEDAWSAADHPLVYISAQGPGYGGILAANAPESTAETSLTPVQSAPGISIHDANTHEAVATAQYEAEVSAYTENHGLAVSADGKWIYTQGNHPDSKLRGGATLNIINARTLKLDKVIESRVHHAKVIHDSFNDRDLVLIEGWGTFFALDPNDDNKVVAAVDPADLRGSGYLGFSDPSGEWLLISVRTGFRESDGGVVVVSLEDWRVKTRINTHDGSPIWVAFTQDGNWAFVSDGHESKVAKIDISAENPGEWRVVGIANAGAIGPYGLTLNWDESKLYTVGKGEASHNQGKTVGITAPDLFSDPDQYRGWGTNRGQIVSNCLRQDHAILHPDPDKNEMWISCNSSFDNVIIDLNTDTVKAVVPQPAGGSSHNGSFVSYQPDWTGDVLSDTNGLRSTALEAQRAMLNLSASAR